MRLVRLMLAVVFLYAGASKLFQPAEVFADGVAAFGLLPSAVVAPFALALPPLEILLGITVFIGRPRRLGAFGALLAISMFLLALAVAFARGKLVECGCFGAGPSVLPLTPMQRMWWDLTRDLLLAAAALLLYRDELTAQYSQART